MTRRAATIALTALASVATMMPRVSRAQEPGVTGPAVGMTPAQLLGAADAAIDAGNIDAAAALYDQIARESPTAPEANEARRALKIIGARRAHAAVPASSPTPPSSEGGEDVVIRREPYSLKTSERLRLTTWEKLDFGVTSFLYGMSVGFSYSLSLQNGNAGAVTTPVALGALAYTVGAVAYLKLGEPDRGDLPLALAISSFLPTTTLLVANVASDHPDGHNVAIATTVVGVLSVPIAILAARQFDPDPGDMQLVRDAGYWGLVLGTTGMLAFGGKTIDGAGYSFYQGPSDRKVFTGSLLGLYGGLGIGTIAALNSEVSLERVRVTTWGGYGGAIIGLLFGGAAVDTEAGLWKGITIGAVGGLVITFLATSGLDGIPPEDVALRAPRRQRSRPTLWQRFTPTLLPIGDAEGRAHTALGITGSLF